jgi:cell division protein FtsB
MFAYAVFGSRGVLRIVQAEKQKKALQLELAEIRQQQEQLHREIERLQKDKSYWEQLARTKLGMVREGELIYYLPDKHTERKRK